MKNLKQHSYWIIGGLAIVALASLLYFGGADTTANTTLGTPRFQVDTEEIELGEIAVQGDYPADFTITNTGNALLEISKVRTSCMCTDAVVIIDGEESPEINMDMYMPNMHTRAQYMEYKNWTGSIAPGKSAIVRVIYKPHRMPVQGSVARNVKFSTNDPQNPVVELGIHATVQ